MSRVGSPQTLLTVTLLTLCTGLGMVLDDLGFVAAVTGAVMGSLIIYVFPALFKLKSLQKLGRPFSAVDTASTYGTSPMWRFSPQRCFGFEVDESRVFVVVVIAAVVAVVVVAVAAAAAAAAAAADVVVVVVFVFVAAAVVFVSVDDGNGTAADIGNCRHPRARWNSWRSGRYCQLPQAVHQGSGLIAQKT